MTRARWALAGVLAVALVLYTWALSGMANTYYSAAVLSATQSWKAFFFGALDAGSFITVDKPPLALWVMALSARIFGFSTWSMLLPQALAGVAAVAVVYSAVRRNMSAYFGERRAEAAGLIAALAMTLTPITVAINRDNNPDTLLVLLLTVAAWFCLEALRTGRPRWLLLCAVFVGLGFNTKMLQAYLVLPAFALAYLFCARATVVRRLGHLLAAGAVLVVSSGWWMAIVDLWPTGSRPYVGGSTDNSVRDLVIGYNGLGRIFGQGGGRAGGPSFGGESGAGRLFNDVMAGQISWLLPFCAIALLLATVAGVRARRSGQAWAWGPWLVWGGWLAVHVVVFSFSSGTFHPYYSTAMAPAVAALSGMGGVLMWRAYREARVLGWVLPVAVVVTGGWAFAVLRRTPEWAPWLAWAVLGTTALAGLTLILARVRRGAAITVAGLVLALVAGLAGPAAYAVTPLQSPVNGTNPTAGPDNGRRGFGGGPMGQPGGRQPAGEAPPAGDRSPGDTPGFSGTPGFSRTPGFSGTPGSSGNPGLSGGPGGREVSAELVTFLEANRGNADWLVAVGSAQQAASLILSTGEPVIAMGGFTGADPAMTTARLEELTSSGRLRYVMTGGGRGSGQATAWVQENCTAVHGQDGLHDCS
ncbi:glycosyltransferase family 39 protein [Nonomuraea sp. NPDC059007]|uniref:glycosyltransferase family 39 protein n=1 Tax=Nonomuraea sp. NPDC059007 TaxID=3346692 RepID=UPI0036863DEB